MAAQGSQAGAVAGTASTADTTDAPQIVEHVSMGANCTPYDVKWIPSSARFVVAGLKPRGTGCLQVYELDVGKATLSAETEKKHGFKCMTFGAASLEERHLATGDYGGQMSIWDLERTSAPVFNVQAHTSLVNAIDGVAGLGIGAGAPEIVTAGRDGCVRLWDPRVQEPQLSLEPEEGKARDCWAVAFGNAYSDDERVIAAGYDNGDVKVFDLRTSKLLWEDNVGNGVVDLQFDRKDIDMNKLLVTTLESKFRVYDMRTQHPTEGFAHLTQKAHKSTVWLGRHLPQNRDVFATTGGNGGLNLYKYTYPLSRTRKDEEGRLAGVMGSVELLNSRILTPQPLVGWDWSPDKEGLAAAVALDQTVRVYIVTKLNKL